MIASSVRLRQLLRRRRRLLTVACAALTLGVFAHHALPEQAMTGSDHGMGQHATAAMVMCLSVAAAAGLWAVGRLPRLHPRRRPTLILPLRLPMAELTPLVIPRARAGPLGPVVLRI
ncbi:hypothetical protein NBH00_21840 [Paraconexibacter antarcticus]|uniref:Uncharacterized protein n=1 Tax=Paraconexibacter antarcticus TaxID=2949664 RepID=A0ABY5DR92_9ACTN|nr:hypothetical protein [Paraconexibacter antarcticus]UTI63970.1 hypothetical protein NBH00_21840 [Paraconexibacter antarcticus]